MTTRYREPEDRRPPSEGSNVFRGDPTDLTGVVLVPVGGVLLRCRFPKQTARPLRPDVVWPPVPEVILMAEKPRITSTKYPDPYATLPIEEPAV